MKVVTVQTTLQVILGVMDDEGDIVHKAPFNVELSKLNDVAWNEAKVKVQEAKEALVKQLSQIPSQ